MIVNDVAGCLGQYVTVPLLDPTASNCTRLPQVVGRIFPVGADPSRVLLTVSGRPGRGGARSLLKVAEMGFADKVSYKAQELWGRVKRNTGEVSGDRRLRREGRADEGKAHLKQAGEKVKDLFRGRGARRRHPRM